MRRSGASPRTVEAELPGLDRRAAVFVLILMLAMGRRQLATIAR